MTSRMTRSPRANFETRARTGREAEQPKESVPGPGAYAHKETLGDTTAVSFLRSEQRKENKSHITDAIYYPTDPGLTSKMQKQAAYGFGHLNTGRIPFKGAENGFDQNDDEVDENGMTQANGMRSPRQTPQVAKRDTVPGPGAYTVVGADQAVTTAAPQWGFGNTEARPRSAATYRSAIQTPGPGTYVRGTMIGGAGPKFSMRGRAETRQFSTPGPGQYGGHWTQFV